jgi:signal transduction histidine kinase
VWTTAPNAVLARLVLPGELNQALEPLWKGQHLVTSLFDSDGNRLVGEDKGESVTLAPGETRLPFVMRVGFGPDWRDDGISASRRWLLALGVALTLALMLAAAYGLSRATSKEMALVRQQSDFVAAVSHEFRTPLTSMRHLTELLANNSVRDEARKATYYQLLARETERLHRMVETLLSYSRMQAGAYAWRLSPARIDDLVQAVVDDFRDDPRTLGRDIGCKCDVQLPQVEIDREAVARAVSNLLENALKYSEPNTPIMVSVRFFDSGIEVSVADQGVGIPADEQKRLFDRFVRGEQAKQAGISGIGIGLALVKSVAEAHGGLVRVVSEPGHGSTFTIALPLVSTESSGLALQTASHVAHPHR